MATTKKTTGKKFPYTTTVGSATFAVTGECEVELPEGSRIALSEHGTKSRYTQMHRLSVPRCAECRKANTQADLAYRARVKAAKPTDLLDKAKQKAATKAKAAPAKKAPATRKAAAAS